MKNNTFQPLSNVKQSEEGSKSYKTKKIIKAGSAQIAGKVRLHGGESANHEPLLKMIYNGKDVTGTVIHCTCGRVIEIHFDYGDNGNDGNR